MSKETIAYTFQASYDCHALWKLENGVKLPKPLEEATEVWIKYDELYVLWEGHLPMSFQLTESAEVEVDSKRPSSLLVWKGEDYEHNNIVYDDEPYKDQTFALRTLLTNLCEQVNDDINPANRTKHLKGALQEALDYLTGENSV